MKCRRCPAEARSNRTLCASCAQRSTEHNRVWSKANAERVRVRRNEYNKEQRKTNTERIREKDRIREQKTQRSAKRRVQKPDYSHECHIRRLLHVSQEEAQRLIVLSRSGSCEACGDSYTRSRLGYGKFGLHIDHNHKTGAFRGFLCSRCNQALGLLLDDPRRIQSLLDYLDVRR